MVTPKEKNESPPNERYQQAEQSINRALAGMSDNTHVEYGSTLERKNKQPHWERVRRWLSNRFK